MSEFLNVSASPHVRDKSSTRGIMLDVCIAMLPATAFGVYQFGIHAAFVIIATVLACVLSEYVYERALKKPVTIGDCSAIVTGLILALNMPGGIPIWMPVVGGIFAIIVVKQVYGGIGQNWMNPALAARCFMLISFAGKMTDFTCSSLNFDSATTATPLAALKTGDLFNSYQFSLTDMFMGTVPGTIGEVSVIALLIGAAYMVIRKVISLRIPLIYMLTVAIFVFVFGEHDINYVLAHLFGGGLLFGAFFMATDYTSSPITPMGQVVFAISIGILTSLFRLFGGSAEGVSYAIIIGNMLVPLIEKYTLPVAFGMKKSKTAVNKSGKGSALSFAYFKPAVVLFAVTLIAGLGLGYVSDITKEPILQSKLKAEAEANKKVFENADSFNNIDLSDSDLAGLADAGYGKVRVDKAFEALDSSGNVLGYVVSTTSSDGFGGDVSISVGITNEKTVNGIAYLLLAETPGLGMKAADEEFYSQFNNKPAGQFEVTKIGAKSDNEINALSGATITSKAVTNAVNAAIYFVDNLK